MWQEGRSGLGGSWSIEALFCILENWFYCSITFFFTGCTALEWMWSKLLFCLSRLKEQWYMHQCTVIYSSSSFCWLVLSQVLKAFSPSCGSKTARLVESILTKKLTNTFLNVSNVICAGRPRVERIVSRGKKKISNTRRCVELHSLMKLLNHNVLYLHTRTYGFKKSY